MRFSTRQCLSVSISPGFNKIPMYRTKGIRADPGTHGKQTNSMPTGVHTSHLPDAWLQGLGYLGSHEHEGDLSLVPRFEIVNHKTASSVNFGLTNAIQGPSLNS